VTNGDAGKTSSAHPAVNQMKYQVEVPEFLQHSSPGAIRIMSLQNRQRDTTDYNDGRQTLSAQDLPL
jgi:hypothetical protein